MCLYDILFQLLVFCLIILICVYVKDFFSDAAETLDEKITGPYSSISSSIESFDEKITRSTSQKCGIMCTKIFDCVGFVSDGDTCYLSKTPILGRPEQSVFGDDYKKNIPRCNKLAKIDDPIIATSNDYKKNATYVCTKNDVDNTQTFKLYDNDETLLSNLSELDNIILKKYTFEEIEWGKEIDLDYNKNLITNPTENNSILVMKQFDEEFLGQYLYPHKCSSNISQADCLLNCIGDNQCVGTEWNPTYFKLNNKNEYDVYKGICCPKIKISKVIPRRDSFKFGKFYLKQNELKDKINDDSVYIKLPKS